MDVIRNLPNFRRLCKNSLGYPFACVSERLGFCPKISDIGEILSVFSDGLWKKPLKISSSFTSKESVGTVHSMSAPSPILSSPIPSEKSSVHDLNSPSNPRIPSI